MMTAILNLLMRSDRQDGYLKNVHSLADGQMVIKYSAKQFPKFYQIDRGLYAITAIKHYFPIH